MKFLVLLVICLIMLMIWDSAVQKRRQATCEPVEPVPVTIEGLAP
jgi:hypothetical protein